MATTALQIFSTTMALMGLLDNSGNADIASNLAHKNKTVPFINLLLPECLIASDTFATVANDDGTHSRTIPAPIAAITDTVPLDDGVCRLVLPYGLAYHLLISEDDTTAKPSLYLQRYEEKLAEMKKTVPAVSEDSTDVYGGLAISNGVRWD